MNIHAFNYHKWDKRSAGLICLFALWLTITGLLLPYMLSIKDDDNRVNAFPQRYYHLFINFERVMHDYLVKKETSDTALRKATVVEIKLALRDLLQFLEKATTLFPHEKEMIQIVINDIKQQARLIFTGQLSPYWQANLLRWQLQLIDRLASRYSEVFRALASLPETTVDPCQALRDFGERFDLQSIKDSQVLIDEAALQYCENAPQGTNDE